MTSVTRRIGAALLLVLATALMAACGSSNSGDTSSTTGDSTTSTAAVEGTITVWDWQYESPAWGKALKQLDEEFMEKYPEVTVKHVGQPFENYNALIQSAFTARSGPDVVMFLPAGTGVLNWTKSLVSLNDRISDEMRNELVGWEVVSEEFDPEKDIYGVPIGIQGNVFWYNKALFRKAGLDPEKPPTTYDELVEACETLKQAGIVPLGGGNKEGYENDWWFTALWGGVATKEEAFELAAGEMSWTDPNVVEVTQKYIDLVEDGFFPPAYSSTPLFTDAVDEFTAGEAAMFLGLATSDASWPQFYPELGEDLGYFQPIGISGPKPNFLPADAGVTWSITDFSDNQDAAWAYAEFMASPRAAEVQYEVGGVLPNNVNAVVPSDAPEVVQGILEDYRNNPLGYPPHGLWKVDVSVSHQRELTLVVDGDKSVEEALNAVQDAQDRP